MMTKIYNQEKIKYQRKALRKSATIHEVILWSRIKNSQLGYKFRRQYSIGKYIVDFCCLEKKLIVEIDGAEHFDSSHDLIRDKYIKSFGFIILRVWNSEINNNLDEVMERVMEMLTDPSVPTKVGTAPLVKGSGIGKIFKNKINIILPFIRVGVPSFTRDGRVRLKNKIH